MKTILIVDDELANAEVLSLILEEEGYRVFCAANGRHGLERVREVNPDLVVLDYMMPIMDGAEMGEALRDSVQLSHIKILMNSSLPEPTVSARFGRYDAFLRKPYSIDTALAVIAQLLSAPKP
ncbi:MAG: response regulator [Rubrivivax sp.]|nr:MAG: response regulator [Rubrivivax sp.]